MTQEKLEYIKDLNYQLNNLTYFFTNDGDISRDSINSLYRYDNDFHDDIINLRNKYLEKYIKLFDEA